MKRMRGERSPMIGGHNLRNGASGKAFRRPTVVFLRYFEGSPLKIFVRGIVRRWIAFEGTTHSWDRPERCGVIDAIEPSSGIVRSLKSFDRAVMRLFRRDPGNRSLCTGAQWVYIKLVTLQSKGWKVKLRDGDSSSNYAIKCWTFKFWDYYRTLEDLEEAHGRTSHGYGSRTNRNGKPLSCPNLRHDASSSVQGLQTVRTTNCAINNPQIVIKIAIIITQSSQMKPPTNSGWFAMLVMNYGTRFHRKRKI